MEVEECMKARDSHVFTKDVEERFFDLDANSDGSHINMRFASVYWQPFLDVIFDNKTQTTKIAGPYMSLLLEIAKRLKFL